MIQPTDWSGKPQGEPLVAADSVGAGAGEFVFYVQSREACFAWLKGNKQVLEEMPPLDATIMGIIDGTEIKNAMPTGRQEKLKMKNAKKKEK